MKMPALFIGHGSPMNVVLDNAFTEDMKALAARLPRPRSILVVSAHWLTTGVFVGAAANPGQLYDFFGFPAALYRCSYRPPGAPDDARSTAGLLGGDVRCDEERGIDHAAWAVLKHIFPAADIPVFEMSLDMTLDFAGHYEAGRRLAALRENGVLVMGSGNIVHSLMLMTGEMYSEPFPWAVEFDERIAASLSAGDHGALIDPGRLGDISELAVPTSDHYIPLLYVAAVQHPGECVEYVHESIQHGSISMRSFLVK